ncbi:pyridoxal-phosphate dependent enzyme [Lentisalinibacter salinarum]|uniref:pyridoxal-phosphate dependent enzyme n=1 Tax=Lentisalinibacter salinarum TaxID=2992239 RepID=UPI003869DFFE
MKKRYENILGTIGDTPVVKLGRMSPPGVEIWVKLEAFNPLGSVKDRMALAVIEDAERRGLLRPGQTVVEATSGNTGIGLAMVCARKGYPLVVVMAENFSVERRRLMRFLGARVVLTPASGKGSGMLAKAEELADAHGWFLCRQFENEANAAAHSETTAREILRDFAGERLDYWVTGCGTGGTLAGVSRVLAEERPETRVVVCEPDNAPVLGSGLRQSRNDDGSPAESHPRFRPHLVQGWSPDFIPRLTETAMDAGLVERVVPVAGDDALRCARDLARLEGILAGTSGGATLAGALTVAETAPAGSVILCMLPDTGERYMSTPLFDEVAVEMDEDEQAISRSTPSFRFDRPAAAAPPPAEEPQVDDEAAAFVERVIADEPVVMFALEWCEFCWSVRKFFEHCGIPYRSIDLDAVEWQEDDRGGRIRAALNARTGMQTIPQVFVGGELVGGCSETFDAFVSGGLQAALKDAGVDWNADKKTDPHGFLPRWLHSRAS